MADLAQLVDLATQELLRRHPTGDGVAAAVLLADGTILTGVGLDCINASGALCAETGPMLEAFQRDVALVATACVGRDSEHEPVRLLAPCGLCRERLAYWGPGVLAAVPAKGGGMASVSLGELLPLYWGAVYGDEGYGDWPAEAAAR